MDSAHVATTLIFSHRYNPDRTFDSICHACFQTVATEANEASLKRHEALHECVAHARANAELVADLSSIAS